MPRPAGAADGGRRSRRADPAGRWLASASPALPVASPSRLPRSHSSAAQKGTAMTNWDFPCSDPVDISIDSWASGSVVVAGQPTTELTVEVLPARKNANVADLIAHVEVSFEDGQLYVRGPRLGSFRRNTGLDLVIKAPTGSSCAAKTASADIASVGELTAPATHTASGDVTAALVTGDMTAQSASGDGLLNTACGALTVQTASGAVQAAPVDGG